MPKRPRTSLPSASASRHADEGLPTRSFRSLLERTLPGDALASLRDLEEAVKDHALGESDSEAAFAKARRALDRAFKAADRARKEEARRRERGAEPVDLSAVVARRLRDQRERDGMTQARLAEDLRARGFGWSRVTVAEVEGGSRKVTLEELLSLAEYFDVPMASLLLPIDGEVVAVRPYARGVEAALVRDLVLGRGGSLGHGLLEGDETESAGSPSHASAELPERSAPRSQGRKERGGER